MEKFHFEEIPDFILNSIEKMAIQNLRISQFTFEENTISVVKIGDLKTLNSSFFQSENGSKLELSKRSDFKEDVNEGKSEESVVGKKSAKRKNSKDGKEINSIGSSKKKRTKRSLEISNESVEGNETSEGSE